VANEDDSPAPDEASTGPIAVGSTSLLSFLMDAAAELNSSLELDKVFHKIATGLRPLIDYHLFCIQLWNEKTQLLEHSFSMKYGKVIPQKGGFPLGYGLCGSCATTRRPIRVANVLADPRYVRFRHPEVEIHSELAVPLVLKDRLIGVLDLESTEFDYFTEEHEQAVSALASRIATALVNARLFERVLRDEKRLETDLATARRTQLRLLPKRNPSFAGLEIGTAYSPALELGGDFYDFLRYRDGRLAVAVGDVAGKATPAALLAAMTVGLLRSHEDERSSEPAALLAEINDHLKSSTQSNRYVTMAFCVYDPESATLKLVNAGLPRPLLARDGRVEEILIEGVPLGVFRGTVYNEETLTLKGGDVIVLCSDGLIEEENPAGDAFGTARVQSVLGDLLSRPAQEIADGLTRAVSDFSGDPALQRDDYTVVVLKYN
jgi:sigma-B regulation protein RsbU (phosphoserine phosphatase)